MGLSFPQVFAKRGGRSQVQQHVYRVLDNANSSDDVEEQKNANILPYHKPHYGWPRWIWITLLISLWVSTALIFSFAIPRFSAFLDTDEPRSFFPAVSMKKYIFDADPAFHQPTNNESNAAWDTLMPPGRGRLIITHPWTYSLPSVHAADPAPTEEYGVSVFHQLHCLGVLRYGWFALEADRDPSDISVRHHLSTAAAMHCFDFLRQALMCNADLTLEPSRYVGQDGQVRTAHGWGVEHTCKDWNVVWAFVMKHHADDGRTGIL